MNFQFTWHKAKIYCESLGMRLLSILSQEESDILQEYLIKSKQNLAYYIAMTYYIGWWLKSLENVQSLINSLVQKYTCIYFHQTHINFHVYLTDLNKDYFWTGGNDLSLENVWVWLNNQTIQYTNWDINQPNHNILNGKKQHCINLKLSKGVYKWADNLCGSISFISYPICEIY